jgi:hypothetical protein
MPPLQMSLPSRWRWSLVAGVCVGCTLVARPAEARYCYCEPPVPESVWVGPAVAREGVVTFRFLTSSAPPDDRWPAAYDYLDVHVLDSNGLEIPGTLERYGDFDVAVWRPAQDWPTDAESVDVHWSVDIDGFVVDEHGLQHDCWPLEGWAVVEIVDRPLPILDPATFETEYGVVHSQALEDLVCCDGAYPALRWGEGHHCFPGGRELWIDEGLCESLAEIGRLTIRASVGLDELDELERSNFVRRMVIASEDDDARQPISARSVDVPVCVQLEVVDLGRGAMHVFESCEAEAYAPMLGRLERDPTPALAACDDTPYVCEVVHHIRWDPEQCTPWPATEAPDIASRACSCGGERRASALGWLVLVFALLHRRSRPSEGGA